MKSLLKRRFKNLNKKQINTLLEQDVFSKPHFRQHVIEVSLKTKIDEKIVEEVLKSYFTNILIVINTFRKIKTKINVYGFFSIHIEKGNRIPKN
jgi:hypothetical protein